MATNIGRISIAISANPSAAVSGLATVQGALFQFESSTRGVMDRVRGYFAGFALFQAGKFMVNTAANIDAARVAMQGLLGDVAKGTELFNQLRAFQQQSPFSLPEVTDAAKRLLGFGIAADQIVPILNQLANVSQGNAESFNLLALVYGQIQSAGRLLGQDANQLNTHFSILRQLAKMTGLEFGDLRKAMEAGAISAEMVAAAFKAATSSGGTFHGAISNFMGSAAGKFKMVQVEVTKVAEILGNILLPAVLAVAKIFLSFIQTISNLGSAKLLLISKVIAFVGVMYISVKAIKLVSEAIRYLVTMYKALTTAEVIAQAFAGPKGWAVILAGVAAAAAGAYMVNSAFAEFESSIANVSAETADLDDQFKELLKPLEQWRNSAKAAGDESAKAGDAAAAAADKLRHRADSLRLSLRTPLEVFQADVGELLQMMQQNMIDLETFRRGYLDARQKFLDAQINNIPRPQAEAAIGAARQNTSEGFSAAQGALRTAEAVRQQQRIQQRQLEAQKEANRILREILQRMGMDRTPFDAMGIE